VTAEQELLIKRLAKRFSGLDRAHGIYGGTLQKDPRKGKIMGKAKTVKEQVTLDKWEAHIKGESGLGIVPVKDDGTCLFGAIDVDIYDIAIEAIERRVRQAELPLVTCRTKSGGIHLYLFGKEALPAHLVRDKLAEWAIALEFPGTEIFPKQAELASISDVGSWINIPYFEGDRTTRYAIQEGKALTLHAFLDLADSIAVTVKQLQEIITKQDDRLEEGPPCLQCLAKTGFAQGTRNKALFNLGVYARKRWPDDWRSKLDELNRDYLDPPLEAEELVSVTRNLNKKDYCYTCRDVPLVNACSRTICLRKKYGIGGSNNDPGVALDGLAKILTEPPTWLVNVDGKRVKLPSTEDLLDPVRFMRFCVDTMNALPRRINRNAWDELIRGLLERVEEVEAPEDAGVAGQFASLLEEYCAEQAPALSRDELLLGKPWSEGGTTYFRSTDMLLYLEKKRMRLSPREAWTMLREKKAQAKAFKLKGRLVRCWGIPSPLLQDKPFDIPDVSEKEDY
jgi:hypothetical protein